MMSGPENLMNQESAFLKALEKARSISIWDSRLVLQDETGGSALEFGH
jgi:heat shock protein HslJ